MANVGVLVRQLQGASKLAFPFGASWADIGGTDEPCTYSRHGRVVRLQGRATNPGAVGANSTVGTLPDGYRPTGDVHMALAVNGGVSLVSITNAGVITVAAAFAGGGFVSLTGFSFVVD